MKIRRDFEQAIGARMVDIERKKFDPRIANFEFAINMLSGGYLDTELMPDTNFAIELDIAIQNVTIESYCGSHSLSGNDLRFYVGALQACWRTGFATNYGDESGIANTSRHKHRLHGDGRRYLDDSLINTYTGNIDDINDTFKLWARANYQYNGIIFYGVKAWTGDTLIANMIPIRAGIYGKNAETPAEAHGFWDTIRHRYYYPTTAGTCILIYTKNDVTSLISPGFYGIGMDISGEFKEMIITNKDYSHIYDIALNLNAEFRNFTEQHVNPNYIYNVDMVLGSEIMELTQQTMDVPTHLYDISMELNAAIEDV